MEDGRYCRRLQAFDSDIQSSSGVGDSDAAEQASSGKGVGLEAEHDGGNDAEAGGGHGERNGSGRNAHEISEQPSKLGLGRCKAIDCCVEEQDIAHSVGGTCRRWWGCGGLWGNLTT